MEKLSPEEIEIIKEACEGYITPFKSKMQKTSIIKEKLEQEDPQFDKTEMSQMFEYIASFATDKHHHLIVDSLRERLRKFKFPPDGIER